MRKILLNPGPVTTSESVKRALLVEDICHREPAFTTIMREIRKHLLQLIDGTGEYESVLFASSGTGAVESMITSIVPKGGKLAVLNNGSYGLRIIQIAKTYNISVCEINCPPEDLPDLGTIAAALESNPEIKYLAVVHHETSTGLANPVEEIGRLCKQRGVTLLVDAISSIGGIPFRPKEWNVGAFTGSANKCIQGMPGCSFVICRKDILTQSKGNARTYYFDLFAQYESLENTGEMRFTPPVQVLYAFLQALKELQEEGLEKRYDRYAENINTLRDGLKGLGFRFFLKDPYSAPLLLAIYFLTPEFDFQKVHDSLFKKGYTIYPGKAPSSSTFRISAMGDLTKVDIAHFLEALKETIENE